MAIPNLAKKLLGIRIKERGGQRKNAAPSPSKSPSSTLHAPTVQQPPQEQQTSYVESSPTSRNLSSFFLRPGEVRNLIYSYAVFPYLRGVTIYHCAGTVFSLPIFHVSRQIRYEAMSYFCASKTIYLSGLNVANDFYATIGVHGISSLRRVVVRCPDAWRSSYGSAEIKKDVFLTHLKYATGLQRFELIIGQNPLSREDLHGLKSPHTSGARFITACKNIVNHLSEDKDEDKVSLKIRVEKPWSILHTEQADVCLQGEHEQHGLRERHGKDVFRLYQVTGIVGKVSDIELPY